MRTEAPHLVKSFGVTALNAHGVPQGLQDLKGDIQQELVEEVHHVLAQTVTLFQRVTWPPAGALGSVVQRKVMLMTTSRISLQTVRTPALLLGAGSLNIHQPCSTQLVGLDRLLVCLDCLGVP